MADHIQIGDIAPRIQYTGDGAETAFTYPFPIFKEADIEVYEDDTLKTLTTNYAVSGAGDSAGGTVTFGVAPAVGVVVTIRRQIAIQRISDFNEGGDLRAKTLNDELDYQTAAIQQVGDEAARGLKLDPTDVSLSATLPKKADRISKYLAFDAVGDPIAVVDSGAYPASTFMATVLDDADGAAARTTLGLVIGTDVLAPDGDGSALTGIGGGADVGDVKMTAVAAAPSLWLGCDGAAVSRTTYADLFAAIGTAYGVGDGSTTFNIPDFRGHAPIGIGTGVGLTARALGDDVGAESVALAEAEMPVHNHTASTNSTGSHSHSIDVYTSGSTSSTRVSASNDGGASTRSTSAGGSHSHTVTVDNTGSGNAHQNMQPSLAINFIIYAGV